MSYSTGKYKSKTVGGTKLTVTRPPPVAIHHCPTINVQVVQKKRVMASKNVETCDPNR